MDVLRHCEKEEAQNRDGKIEGSSMSILSKSSRRMKKESNEVKLKREWSSRTTRNGLESISGLGCCCYIGGCGCGCRLALSAIIYV